MTNASAQTSVLSGAQRSVCAGPAAFSGLSLELAQRESDHERNEDRAHAPPGDRDVERGDGVGRGLDQPPGGPDRRDRHGGAIENRSRAVARRREPPGRKAGREHSARERVDGDQRPRGVERRVDHALDARIGKVERVERARQEAEAGERQRREDEEDPCGGERAAEPARRGCAGIATDDPAREPPKRRDGQQQCERDRRNADLQPRRQPVRRRPRTSCRSGFPSLRRRSEPPARPRPRAADRGRSTTGRMSGARTTGAASC